ncbi:MAG: DNA adenine methylase [Burkholderiales bacterium]|nr:DNA adenine methylase [Burkholderiales bacterium]
MIKSPLRYPGGKSRAVALIEKLIPPFDEFREPFLGGGSVFVYVKQRHPDKKYWVNDLYFDLYNFWAMAEQDVHKLIEQIYAWRRAFPVGKALFQFLNQNIDAFNPLEKAAAFFIFNRITFSGTTLSGGYSEAAFKGRFTESSITRLLQLSPLLKGSSITQEDYETLITTEGKNVFIFLDPPYYSATKSALYGKNGHLHKSFDHVRLAKTLKNCKHPWLMTYDDSPYIRELFSFAHVIPWHLTYGMRNVSDDANPTGKELFISNFMDARTYHAKRDLLNLFHE